MKKFITFAFIATLASCVPSSDGNTLDITSQFTEKWNINEDIQKNSDGSITYSAMTWGGMVANFANSSKPTDWTAYEKIVFEFAEPTEVPTQVIVNDKMVSWANGNITSMEGSFAGVDVSTVNRVVLQTAEPTTINVKRVYLTVDEGPLLPTNLWEGRCELGNYVGSFMVNANVFDIANEGDMLEFVYNTDKSNPSVTYWQIKTTYGGVNKPLEGNATELNAWGCATVGENTTVHRIKLTANDIINLRKYGLFVNGYYLIMLQCNLLQ